VELPKNINEAARKLLSERFGSNDFVVVRTATDTHPETKGAMHLIAAVPAKALNEKPVELILDDKGRHVDLPATASHFLPIITPVSAAVIESIKAKIDPPANDLKLGECDKFTETITVAIPKSAATEKADVYFLADNTGSMGPVIASVQAGANNILTALLGTGIDLHFGVGSYRDFPGPASSVFMNLLPLTGNAATVPPAINTWNHSCPN